MANYYTLVSVLFRVGSAENVKSALALYQQFADELEAKDECIGFEAEAEDSPGTADLWLHSDEDADVENIFAFALRCAEAFDLRGLWGFRWALTCSKPSLDGYGGGAQLFDLGARRSLSWIDTEHWLGDQIARLEQPAPTTDTILDAFEVPQDWTADVKAAHLRAFLDREIAADRDVADRFRAFLTEVSAGLGPMPCRECGKLMFIEENGVSHHAGDTADGIDHGRDLDHGAVAEREA
jgi:hypothetical protein